MIPAGTFVVARPTGGLDAVAPDTPGYGWLWRALDRRGVALTDDLDSGVTHAVIGAPPTVLGPSRVRALRFRVSRGLRLLLIASDEGDAAWLISGLERAVEQDGRAVLRLRGRARFEPDLHQRGMGQLWPQGRGWFRFGRAVDVSAGDGSEIDDRGRAADPRWSWLQLRVGQGEVTVVADAAMFHEASLAEPRGRDLASRTLQAWLPGPEGACDRTDPALILGAAPPELLAGIEPLIEALSGPGLPPDLAVDPARVPALRALGEAGLARAFGLRVRLSDAGRAELDRVRATLAVREVLRAADVADLPVRGPASEPVG